MNIAVKQVIVYVSSLWWSSRTIYTMKRKTIYQRQRKPCVQPQAAR